MPKGVEFQALQLPAYKELTKFIADEDLAVLYKGSLLELEEEANRRVFKTARAKKKEGTLLGIIGSISALLAGLAGKKIIKKKVKK
uniref:Uncharacterized protein n=1 Tax=viral metagenome TaxID=1070528 RepID=A0A6H1ZAA7_9ZZZZ